MILNLEISEKIKGKKSQLELSRKIRECKIEHRDKRQTLHNDLNIDENLKVYFYPYLKYLCAVNFTKQFRLSPTDTTSVSFYAISAIINSESKQSATYQINTIEKELNKFKCLSFYDDEFKSMIKTMLRYKFNLFESILSIYKKKVNDFLKFKDIYKEDLQPKLDTINSKEIYQVDIIIITDLLGLGDSYYRPVIEKFLKDMKSLFNIRARQKIGQLENITELVKAHRRIKQLERELEEKNREAKPCIIY